MRVTLIKTGAASEALEALVGGYEYWFARGFAPYVTEWEVIDAFHGEDLPSLDQVDAVVVTGSPVSVYDYADWSVRTGKWLAELVLRDQVPVLGICYGHQLLAEALGGKVALAPHGREIGNLLIDHVADDLLFEGLSTPLEVWQTHSDEVTILPSQARVIASNQHTYVQGMAIGKYCRTLQWHPEMTYDIQKFLIESRTVAINQESGAGTAEALLAQLPKHVASGYKILHNFAKHWLSHS